MVRLGCAVLGVSFLVEGYSLLVATRAVVQGAQAMGMSFWEYLRRGMDPTTVAVMMEDGAAVTGLLIAGESRWLFSGVLCTMERLGVHLAAACTPPLFES